MTEKTKVGIATHYELRERALQIARGERRRRPSEPKIWFTSLESLAKVLSEPNRKLLKIIDERRPSSLAELEVLTGRKASNLSRTLKTMSQYGLVKLSWQARLCCSRGVGTRSADGPFHCGIGGGVAVATSADEDKKASDPALALGHASAIRHRISHIIVTATSAVMPD